MVQKAAFIGTESKLRTATVDSPGPPYLSEAHCQVENVATHSPGPVYDTRGAFGGSGRAARAPALHGQGHDDRFHCMFEAGRLK